LRPEAFRLKGWFANLTIVCPIEKMLIGTAVCQIADSKIRSITLSFKPNKRSVHYVKRRIGLAKPLLAGDFSQNST
jgi:hypothetical protein